jgi:PAS domain S-box-containing protein
MKKKPTPSPEVDNLRRNPRPLLRAALIIAAYLCAFTILDLLSRQFEELQGVVAWYPPAGLTYTLLLVFGVRFAPAVTIALFISSLFIYRMPQPPYLLFLWALIISLIYSVAAAFLRHRIRFDWQLRKLRDVTWLVVTTVFVSALLAVLSVSSSALSSDMPRSEVLRAIIIWWIGETVGVLTVTPFLLIHVMPLLKRFAEGQPVRLPARRSFPRPALSVIGQALSIAFMFYWVFDPRFLDEFRPMYLITLPLVWIALDHGFKRVTAGIVVLNFGAMLALWFFRFDLAHLGELQLLMIVNCIVGLFMGAVVTERKQGEAALRVSEEHLRLVTDNMEDMVIRADLEGLILYASPSHKTVLGYEPEYLVGRSVYDFMHPEDIDRVREFTLAALQAQTHGKQEFRYRHSDGHYLWLESAGAIIFDKGGSPAGAVFSTREITERKQREEEIRSRTEELAILYSLSRLLADANDLESVFELVNHHAVESVHVTFACLALVEDGDLVRRAVYPVRILDHDFTLGGHQPIAALPSCQRVLDKNEPVILRAGSSEVSRAERATLILDFAQTVCLVPLRVGDSSQQVSSALGLLILGEVRAEKREPFTPGKVRLARSIGDQAAAAIRRLLLHAQAGHRLQRLASLSEIDRTIASNFDLRLSLQMILRHVIEQLEVDAADVLLFNDRLMTLEFAAGRGFRSKAIERKWLRLDKGQAGQAALERRIIQIPDVTASGAVFAQPELLEAEEIAAYFAVPLITKGQVKGVMEIYQRTPLEPNEEWLDFLNTLAGQAAIAIDNVQLFDNLQRSNTELALAYDATIEGWSHALDLRDKETEGHTQRVVEIMLELSRKVGMKETDLVHIRRGTLLHDIGKMGVLDGILLKPGPLTDEEWVVMKRHPALAYEMLSPIRYLHAALDIPYCHHEKWDGTGYPRGLKGEQIPLAARLFAVVDVWDALRSDRPYREAWPEEKVLEHIRAQAGTHFDPKVVELFLKVMSEKANEHKQGAG